MSADKRRSRKRIDDRLIDLLEQWEEGRRQGREPTPEELCPDDDHLRQELSRRIAGLRHLDGELG